jgi:hypothetical protein
MCNTCIAQHLHMQITSSLLITEILNHLILLANQYHGGGRGDWMELAQNRDRWQALVSMVRNFRVP